jgi:hypothetical protein
MLVLTHNEVECIVDEIVLIDPADCQIKIVDPSKANIIIINYEIDRSKFLFNEEQAILDWAYVAVETEVRRMLALMEFDRKELKMTLKDFLVVLNWNLQITLGHIAERECIKISYQ